MIVEWDIGSYRRKFSGTWAYCQSQNLDPDWRFISEFSDDGAVYSKDGLTIGFVCPEANRQNGESCPEPELYFEYRSIGPGLFMDKNTGKPILITKIHQKQYEIGIGGGGYQGYALDERQGTLRPSLRWASTFHPDFENPCPKYCTELLEIYNSQLFRLNKHLYCYKEVVGFMEDGLCFLRNLKFTPIVKHYLGEKWQIVNL